MARRNLAKTLLLGGAFSLVLSVSLAEAQRGGRGGGGGGGGARASAGGGGGGGARAGGARSAPTSINGNRGGGNVNRGGGNVNRGGGNTVNNVNVNRNVAVAGGGGYGYNNGCCNGGYDNDGYHPVAAAMVVGATAAVVSNAMAPKPVVVAPY